MSDSSAVAFFGVPELVATVGLYLSPQDVAHCAATCKALSTQFEPLLWREPELRDIPPPAGLSRHRCHLRTLDIGCYENQYLDILAEGLPSLPTLSYSADASTPLQDGYESPLTDPSSVALPSNVVVGLRKMSLVRTIYRYGSWRSRDKTALQHTVLFRILNVNTLLTYLNLPASVLTQDPLLTQCFLDIIATKLQQLQCLIVTAVECKATGKMMVVSAETSAQFLGTCVQHPRLIDLQCRFSIAERGNGDGDDDDDNDDDDDDDDDNAGDVTSTSLTSSDDDSLNPIPKSVLEVHLMELLKLLTEARRLKKREAGQSSSSSSSSSSSPPPSSSPSTTRPPASSSWPLRSLKLPAIRGGYPDSFLDRFLTSLDHLEQLDVTEIIQGHEDELELLVEECCPNVRKISCKFDYHFDHGGRGGEPVISVIHGIRGGGGGGGGGGGLTSFQGFGYHDVLQYWLQPSVLKVLVDNHSETLEEIELLDTSSVMDKDLLWILTKCRRLKKLRMSAGQALALEKLDGHDWVCLDMEELELTVTKGHSMPYNIKRREHVGTSLLRRQAANFYTQIGRLKKLQKLTLGFRDREDERLFEGDLTLSNGYLSCWTKLKELRHLRMPSCLWSQVRWPDLEFMDQYWPKLGTIAFGITTQDILNITVRSESWWWWKKRRPWLRLTYYTEDYDEYS
ncbi:hypothetical protein EDD11_000740 [Mortierella claussenii]|nr:hypothetical protein EDD11_000740 [Mortierella claussenii]